MPVKPPIFRPGNAPKPNEYDHDRGSAHSRGYDRRWTDASAAYREHHPLCVGCAAVGRLTPTALVDHVVPHQGDMKLFWCTDNWQSTCRPHHDVIKQRMELLFAQGKCSRFDLRLDSRLAIELTNELLFKAVG